MKQSSFGPYILALVLVGIGLLLFLSLEPAVVAPKLAANAKPTVALTPEPSKTVTGPVAGFREYPIGDPEGFTKNQLRIAAVWLPSVTMDGASASSSGTIHVEADISATENNTNGFASGEFVPYLKIAYKLTSEDGKTVIDQGAMLPMVARDGLHYGTSMVPPKPGNYRLMYTIEPPSAGGLGRHHDPVTGVAPWWEPFQVTFEWEFNGVPALLGSR
ncbi:MAG: iron transporter [Planctomycetota bacterium]|nr:iron transporter [Planctomycetota bacterium]RLS26284.1 MAG: high-affinity Fe2+ transport protein [Planctomycetota bacterium]